MATSPTPDAKESAVRSYYDEFARGYEAQRRPAEPDGYHAMIDDLEVDYTLRFAAGKDVLEVGCGTGLILGRLVSTCRSVKGVDLSPGMLEKARDRGLDVELGSATALPFKPDSFDVVCSFKVLAHVPEIGRALAEMVRVTRPGGYVLAEFYNPISLRALAKWLGPAGAISESTRESAVYTRFDPPWTLPRILPAGTKVVGSRGVRIVTPTASAMRIPGLKSILRSLETRLCDTPLRAFGGFWIAAIQKTA